MISCVLLPINLRLRRVAIPNRRSSFLVETPSAEVPSRSHGAAQTIGIRPDVHWGLAAPDRQALISRESDPGPYRAVRADLKTCTQVPPVTLKTLQNHKSNVKRAVLCLRTKEAFRKWGDFDAGGEALRREILNRLVRAWLRVDAYVQPTVEPAG